MVKKLVSFGLILIVLIFGFILFENFKKGDAASKKKFTFWSIQLKPVYEKEILAIISEFEQKHPDYKVVWVDIPIGEAQKRTLASILSSNPPDLVNLNPDFSILLAQKNALYLFDEKDTESFNSNLANKLKYKDRVYALPFYFTSPVTIYNKEVYSNCISGDVISKYDELNSIFNEFNKCENKPKTMALFSSNLNENDTLAKILNKYDVKDLKTNEEKEKTVNLFKMFDDLYKQGGLPKDTLTINHREVVEKYMSENALIAVLGSNFINMVKQNAPDIYKKSELAPQLTGASAKFDISLMNLIIPKKSQNIELALEFSKMLTSYENQLKLAKITNVLPANVKALDDEYFLNCSSDLYDKSRCIARSQLKALTTEINVEDKKAFNESINKTLEEILLNKNSNEDLIKNRVETLSKQLKLFLN